MFKYVFKLPEPHMVTIFDGMLRDTPATRDASQLILDNAKGTMTIQAENKLPDWMDREFRTLAELIGKVEVKVTERSVITKA